MTGQHADAISIKDSCPRSEIPFLPSVLSALFFVASIALGISFSDALRHSIQGMRSSLNIAADVDVIIALCIMLVSIVPMLVADIVALKNNRAQQVVAPVNTARVLFKILGLWGTFSLLAFVYWLLPEYGGWYEKFWSFLWLIMPVFIIASPLYIAYTDRRQIEAEDSYYHLGLAIAGLVWRARWTQCNPLYLQEHLRQWLIKGFFLPLMSIFFFKNITQLLDFNISSIKESFGYFYDFSYLFLYSIDVLYAAVGYLFTFKLLNTDIRSAEPSLLGWLVCLMCYPPFWNGLLGKAYFDYSNDYYWGHWLSGSPVVHAVWGSLILLLISIYVTATISLGYRFSNLTYRGLTTSGVYRWTKHPAYVSKNITWWMISIPFVSQGDVADALRACLLLSGVNYIYYLRAKTEERHLSHYPEYVEYAQWINRHGIFRWLTCVSPAFKYDETKVLAAAKPPWWMVNKANALGGKER